MASVAHVIIVVNSRSLVFVLYVVTTLLGGIVLYPLYHLGRYVQLYAGPGTFDIVLSNYVQACSSNRQAHTKQFLTQGSRFANFAFLSSWPG